MAVEAKAGEDFDKLVPEWLAGAPVRSVISDNYFSRPAIIRIPGP
jgi:hypothetical protein